MADKDELRIPVAALEDFVTRIFAAAGCDAEESSRVARYLVAANLTGHDSHGVVRVPRYVGMLRDGGVVAGRVVEVVSENGAMAVVDGRMGLGQTVAPQAVGIGIAKALAGGCAVIALRNAGHIGRVGDWAEMAAARGVLSIHFVNAHGSVLVAPFGGAERRFSTAPFCVGVPRRGAAPVVLDFATSLVAEGKVLVASSGGKALPEGALIEADGRLSTDPHTLYGPYEAVGPRDVSKGTGAIRAFGEHKGSGLAFMCEMLAGCLTAGGTSGPVSERSRIANGMLSIFISPKHFGTQAEFERMGLIYADWVSETRPADPAAPVLLPGEPEATRRAERLADGVPLPPDTWANIIGTAKRLGVNSSI